MRSFLLTSVAMALAPVHCLSQTPLIPRIVDALNSTDPAVLRDFILQDFTHPEQVDQRIERLGGFAEQGRPFTFVRMTVSSPGQMKGILRDVNGMELEMTIELSPTDSTKVDRVRIGPPSAAATKDYRKWTSLNQLVAAIRSDSNSPAMAIAYSNGGMTEVAVSGKRTIGGADVTANEPWSVGSIGKPICSTIIGRLIDAHKLKFETQLGDVIPGLARNTPYSNVTIQQLMMHRGGVPQDPGMMRPRVQSIVAGATDPRQIRLNYARDILGRPPIAPAGTRFAYSNAGYALLGVVAERLYGESYEQIVKHQVFARLHLTHSFTSADKLPVNRPSGHIPGPQGLRAMNMNGPIEYMFAAAGGGIFMSVGDLAAFGNAHLQCLTGHDGILRAATATRIHTGLSEGSAGQMEYACGWGIEHFPGLEPMHAHNGSNGTMRAQLSIFPKMGLVVSSFVNCGGETEPSPPLQAALAVAHKFADRK